MPGSLTISHKERYPGLEFCCDSCNDLLDIISFYYRPTIGTIFLLEYQSIKLMPCTLFE